MWSGGRIYILSSGQPVIPEDFKACNLNSQGSYAFQSTLEIMGRSPNRLAPRYSL